MKIYEIPGKLVVSWESDVKAVLDTWTDYHVTLDEFKEAVLVKGLDYAKLHNAIAWIVDSSGARGVFSQEIQEFIATDVFKTFKANGVKYFITIKPESPGLTTMTVRSYSSKAGPAGIGLVDVKTIEDAKMWLRENAN